MIQKNDIMDGRYYFELYAQNDIHGRFFNSKEFESGEDVSVANISTYLRGRRGAIGAQRVLAIDCGDNLQGDLAAYYSNKKVIWGDMLPGERHIFPRIAEYIGLDAVVVGNHDLEAGHLVYDRVRVELEEAGIPYLAANAIGEDGDPYFTPYKIVEREGIRIAVVGLANPLIYKWLPRELWSGIEFRPLLESARRCIEELQRVEKPHLVILAVHSGVGVGQELGGAIAECGAEVQLVQEHGALELARELVGADIVLASHDHKEFCGKIVQDGSAEGVLLISAASHAHSLQCAKISLQIEGGKVVSKSIEGEIVSMKGILPDEAYLEFFREDIEQVKRYSEEVIGRLHRPFYTREALFGACDYVNFMHALQLQVSGAQISFISPYAYNFVVPEGGVTRNHLFAMHSCENFLYKIKLSGEKVKDYLEYSYSKWVCSPSEGGVFPLQKMELGGEVFYWHPNKMYNFDSAGGIYYSVDVTKSVGNRVEITTLFNGEPFDLQQNYTVVLSSYRVSGGGDLFDIGAGINPLEQLPAITLATYPLIRELMEEYFTVYGDERHLLDSYPPRNWNFVPEKIAAQAIEKTARLLFK